MEIKLTKKAIRDLNRLPKKTRKEILDKLEFFVSSGHWLFFAKALKDHEAGEYRFRIGKYRVIVDKQEDIIRVNAVGHRREIYK